MAKIRIKDEEAIRIAQPLLDKAIDWQEQKSHERQKAVNLYNMAAIGGERDGYSKSVAGTVFECVEWLKPGLTEIFTHPDFFSLKMSDKDRADRLKKALRHQMFRKQRGAKEIRAWLHDTLLYHNGVFKIWYREDFDFQAKTLERITSDEFQQLEQDPHTTVSLYTEVEEFGMDEAGFQTVYENVKATHKKMKYAGPVMQCVPAWEFFITPGSRSIDTAPLVAHRVKKSLHDIKKGELSGQYKKGSYAKLKDRMETEHPELEEEITSLFGADELDYQDGDGDVDNTHDKVILSANEFWVWECYLRLDIDNDGMLEPVILTFSGDTVLQLVENPYKRPPFRAGCIYEIPHRFEGKMMPLVLEKDQVELSNLQRILVDSAADAAYGTMVTDDPMFAQNWADRMVGDVVLSGRSANYESVRPDQPGKALLDAIEMREGHVERKTGVNRYNQGLDADSLNKTATGMQMIQSAGAQRQKFFARVLGDTPEAIIRDFIEINKLFPSTVTMPDEEPISPEEWDIEDDFDVSIVVGVGPQDRYAQAQQLEMHFQKIVQVFMPQGAAGMEHAIRTQSRIGKLLDSPVDDLMFDEDEFNTVQQMQQQIQQLTEQLQQMQGHIQNQEGELQNVKQENQNIQLRHEFERGKEEAFRAGSAEGARQQGVNGQPGFSGAA